MAIFFALLYILTAYLAPETLFGDELGRVHIEVVIAGIALILAFFAGAGSGFQNWVQTWAIVGVSFAVAMSLFLVWGPGGGRDGLLQFVPNAAGFFMVALSCKKKWQLQAVVGVLLLAATFIILNAAWAEWTNAGESHYLLYQIVDEATGTYITRIRGLSFLGDPNDLAQFCVSLIPLLFLFWAKGSGFRNVLMVYLPSAFLIFGMYLSHSRGGMLALLVMIMVAVRKRVGLVPAAIASGVLFAGLTAAGFTGGRDVSAGEDRIGAWSEGLNLIRSHPLFGVGYQRFSDFYTITAHNTFVVCAAELGLVGVFFWLLLIVVTLRNAYAGTLDAEGDRRRSQEKERLARSSFHEQHSLVPAEADGVTVAHGLSMSAVHRPMPAHLASMGNHQAGSAGSLLLEHPLALEADAHPQEPAVLTTSKLVYPGEQQAFHPFQAVDGEALDDAELRRLSNLITISFVGFLTAGWFLSRAYTMCLYVNAGLAAAVYQMALARGLVTPMPLGRALKSAVYALVGLLLVIYAIVITDHLMPH